MYAVPLVPQCKYGDEVKLRWLNVGKCLIGVEWNAKNFRNARNSKNADNLIVCNVGWKIHRSHGEYLCGARVVLRLDRNTFRVHEVCASNMFALSRRLGRSVHYKASCPKSHSTEYSLWITNIPQNQSVLISNLWSLPWMFSNQSNLHIDHWNNEVDRQ